MATLPAVEAIAEAIKAGFQLLSAYKKDRHVIRLRTAIDSAEKYILENEKEDSNKKLLSKYKKLFFKYNQG